MLFSPFSIFFHVLFILAFSSVTGATLVLWSDSNLLKLITRSCENPVESVFTSKCKCLGKLSFWWWLQLSIYDNNEHAPCFILFRDQAQSSWIIWEFLPLCPRLFQFSLHLLRRSIRTRPLLFRFPQKWNQCQIR